jgi:putative peptidoglycan lipid II flippase
MSLGGLGCVSAQLCLVPERRFLFHRAPNGGGNAACRNVLLLMGPLVIGVIFSHLNGLVDNLLASMLPAGQLSFLGYSKKLIDALLLIGPVALVTVVYSQLSHLASAKDYENFTLLLRRGFRLIVYLSVPAACALATLRQPLIRLLFERGRFGPESTLGTSDAFLAYALGLTVFSLEALLVHGFFAASDTRTPIKIGVLCSLVDIALALALMRPLQYLGIAWAFVVARTIKVILLGTVLNGRFAGIFGRDVARFAVKLAVSTLALWVVMKLLLSVESPDLFLHRAIFDLLAPLTGAAVTFAACSRLLRIDEFNAVVALVTCRKAAIKTLYGEGK